MRLATTLLAASLLFAATPASAQSLEQMAGQMIVVGFTGTDASDKSVVALRKEIAAGDIGGVMFLKTNVKSRAAVEAMNAAFREASPGLPPFITLDQEGGLVERLTSAVGFTEIPDAATVAAEYYAGRVARHLRSAGEGHRRLGFQRQFRARRRPGREPGQRRDRQVRPRLRQECRRGRRLRRRSDRRPPRRRASSTSLKHFPGHGSSTADSHEGFVDITRTWSETELEPYRALIAGGYRDFVMIGHLIDTNVDPSGLPSSLSKPWIEGVLRGQLGFEGVVITDDLEMGAIRDHFDLAETVVKAVEAGVDVLLFSNTVKPRVSLGDEVRAILVARAEADPAFRARIEQSYARIVALKQRIGR